MTGYRRLLGLMVAGGLLGLVGWLAASGIDKENRTPNGGVPRNNRESFPRDYTKSMVVERPTIEALKQATAPTVPPRLDRGKSELIEPSIKAVVATNSAGNAPKSADVMNPKVEPGKVRWHATLEDAQKAAAKSKKPILLFQMMGKLDQEFC